MTRPTLAAGLLACLLVMVVGCDGLPGRPRGGPPPRPSQVTDFATLYGRHCAGCHGTDRHPGAAVSLADPIYLALVDDAALRRVAADGVPGTIMAGFARRAGGALTDRQIDAIVDGMRSTWGRPDALGGDAPPAWAAPPGDAGRGAPVYDARCASCHGPGGRGGPRGGSIVDGSYLALVSDQGLRTAVLAGRPARGMPDWRGDGGGPPLTAADVADVVAWLIAQRPGFAGRPHPTKERHDG